MRRSIDNIYAGCRAYYKIFVQMKLGRRLHNTKLENGIKNQPVVMQGYICNICGVVYKAQYKMT